MRSSLKGIFALLFLCISLCAYSQRETVILFSSNGNGGIQQNKGVLGIKEGQYYIKFVLPNEKSTDIYKVYKIREHADLMYDQPSWASKYAYLIEKGNNTYYFNMKSKWIPSLTDDPDDPNFVRPIKKIYVYEDNYNGTYDRRKAVWVKQDGKDYLYVGDKYFFALVYRNDYKDCPDWARKFKYKKISGCTGYFNLE